MDATGSDVESPFLPEQDPDVAGQPRPLLDHEVMHRLRTPLEADPFDALDQQRVVVLDEDDYRS